MLENYFALLNNFYNYVVIIADATSRFLDANDIASGHTSNSSAVKKSGCNFHLWKA